MIQYMWSWPWWCKWIHFLPTGCNNHDADDDDVADEKNSDRKDSIFNLGSAETKLLYTLHWVTIFTILWYLDYLLKSWLLQKMCWQVLLDAGDECALEEVNLEILPNTFFPDNLENALLKASSVFVWFVCRETTLKEECSLVWLGDSETLAKRKKPNFDRIPRVSLLSNWMPTQFHALP